MNKELISDIKAIREKSQAIRYFEELDNIDIKYDKKNVYINENELVVQLWHNQKYLGYGFIENTKVNILIDNDRNEPLPPHYKQLSCIEFPLRGLWCISEIIFRWFNE